LASLPNVYEARDLIKFKEESIIKCKQLRDHVVGLKDALSDSINSLEQKLEAARDILNSTDEISNVLCKFLDGMEFIRNVHAKREFREMATKLYGEFAVTLHELNCDVELHNTQLQVAENLQVFNLLDPMEQRCATLLKLDMEKHSGVHELSDTDKVVQLSSLLDSLAAEYNQVVGSRHHEQEEYFEITEKQAREVRKEHAGLVRYIMNENGEKVHVIPSSQFLYALAYVSDPDIRQQAYMLEYKASDRGLELLDMMTDTRSALATELRKPSYAHAVIADQCAATPEGAWDFLLKFAKAIQPKINEEMTILRRVKAQETGEDFSQVVIQPWDVTYYTKLIKKAMSPDTSDSKYYFSLENCLNGLMMICDRLFGLRFEPEPMQPGESWHASAQKYRFIDSETSEVLGYFYTDLYYREGKNASSSNFSLQTAKTLIGQKPITALVCSFNPPSRNEPSLLQHQQVVTLFHEFGHALHMLLGQTPYQTLSGTRTAVDFVEAPSQFFEHFAWDYRVLSKFALHCRTKQPIPEKLLQQLVRDKTMFWGISTSEQIVHSLMDIAIHSNDQFMPISKDNMSKQEVYRKLVNEYHCIPFAEGTSEYGQFVHFNNYPAVYYSYSYCKVFSSHLWEKFFVGDPLNREAGKKYRFEVLAFGGGKDPNTIAYNILGQQPDPRYLLKDLMRQAYVE
jgi:intermediate peptidase